MPVASSLHAIEELIRSGTKGTLYVSRKGDRRKKLARDAEKSGSTVSRVSDSEIERLLQRGSHAGVAFVYASDGPERPSQDIDEFVAAHAERTNLLVLILDGITDPQNVGAILRTADKFEVDAVISARRRSAGISDAVHRSSSGASAYVPFIDVVNIHRSIQLLQEHDFWVYGADIEGEPLTDVTFSGRTAIIMGSEGKGMSRLSRELCDGLIRIPSGGHVDSFNVSVAAGIVLYEVTKGRF